MTNGFPDDGPYDDDYPPPPDVAKDGTPADIEPDVEDEAVPVPAPAVPAHWVTVPRARRILKDALEATKGGLASLKKLQLGEQVQLDAVAVDALICGARDWQYPIGDSNQVDRLRESALSGRYDRYVLFALDELEDVLTIIEAALSALKVISLLGEPIPGAWDNLHAVLLARKLNGLGHTLLRGRIPGVNL